MGRILQVNSDRPEPEIIAEAVKVIRSGGVCAYPTETFYGLGVAVSNEQAIKRLFDFKRRDYGNPVAVIVSDRTMLASIVREIPEKALRLMDQFWPGPLTILFETNATISKSLTTNTGKIGIRISSHPVAMALVRALGHPLTTTSANLSGFSPSFSLKNLKSYFQDRLDHILDGGQMPESFGSTVVDVSEEKVTLIREGVIKGPVLFEPVADETSDRAEL